MSTPPTRVESPDIEHLFEVYTSTGYVPEADFVLFGSEITGRLRKKNNGDGSSIFYPDELVNIVLDVLKYRGKMADNLRKDKWWLLFARLAEHEGVQPLSIGSDVSDLSEDEAWDLLEEMYRE